MSIAIGMDLVGVDEVEAAIQVHGERYLRRVYTDQERRECGGDARRLAARFAAKEATMKVLRRSDEPLAWRTIAVSGGAQPAVELTGDAAVLAERGGVRRLSVSLAGRRSTAAAIVVAEVRG
jgi:holo-[acyl-carrier protein] synthase